MSLKETYDWYAKEGYLTAHRQGGLTLYNYTNRCVFEGNWNYHTLTARGLIMDDEGKFVARPWGKFFNLNERPESRIEAFPVEVPELADKYDGSLIIVFLNPETGRWQAVTRGAWENVQISAANRWLEKESDKLLPGKTYLFELVAPWNRIVVAYDREEMVLLGVVDNESGQDLSYGETALTARLLGWTPLRFEKRPLDSLDLDDRSIVNREGYVARFSNGARVKLKYAQYMLLHKILTGLSVKGIWESLSSKQSIDLSLVPDEFVDWFNKEKCKLENSYREVEARAKEIFAATPNLATRKEYAEHFMRHEDLSGILFRMLDGKPYSEIVWKRVRPEVHRTFQKDEA